MNDVSAGLLAFGGSLGIAVAATPLARRVALASGVVDQPQSRKSHSTPTPYLGGLAIMAGALLGPFVRGSVSGSTVVLIFTALALGAVGLLDDRSSLDPMPRVLAEIAAAAVAVAVGVRAEVTGIVALDVMITILWVVGITNALNLLDNMDGLAAGVAVVAGSATFALAMLADQFIVAQAAAGLVGACLGFLVYNRRPASIFMGDAGSLFLGYVLALVTLEADPSLVRPASFTIPVILLALPVVDTTMVCVERIRHGRTISTAGKDHISHRLVVRGLPPGRAVAMLLAFEAAMGVLAVLGGRGRIPIWTAIGCAIALVGLLVAVTLGAPVYPEKEDAPVDQDESEPSVGG